jgi:hypothetical protein
LELLRPASAAARVIFSETPRFPRGFHRSLATGGAKSTIAVVEWMQKERKEPRVTLDLGHDSITASQGGLDLWDGAVESSDTIDCVVTGLAAGSVVAEVRSAVFDLDRQRASIYWTTVEASLVDGCFHASVPLLAGAVNRITFLVPRTGELIGTKAVLAAPHPLGFPAFFKWLKEERVTDKELDAELAAVLDLVRKVSRELGPCTQGPIVFAGDGPATGRIDTEGGNGLDNIRTRLDRESHRQLLLSIKCAPSDEERARRREDATMQLLSQLLHEVTHRCRLASGAADDYDLGGEEDAVTTDLARRLITLLGELEPRLAPAPGAPPPAPLGDGAGLEDEAGQDLRRWFGRLRRIVCRQVCYRFEKVAPRKSPHKAKFTRVRARWRRLEGEVQRIRDAAGTGIEEKRTQARAALERFESDTRTDRTELEEAFDVEWTFKIDDAVQPIMDLDCRDTFRGQPIPLGDI